METTATRAVALTLGGLRRVRALKGLLVGTLLFNLLDLVLTLVVVLTGLAIEANPVMAEALDAGPLPFSLVKLALVSMGVWIIWRYRHRPAAVFAGGAVFAAYVFVLFVHMKGVHLASLAMVMVPN
ncbi:MAG: DUF5658 family protein [Polyangiales bacterium]|nr:hypothetical protein [Myxococcales bacterium]